MDYPNENTETGYREKSKYGEDEILITEDKHVKTGILFPMRGRSGKNSSGEKYIDEEQANVQLKDILLSVLVLSIITQPVVIVLNVVQVVAVPEMIDRSIWAYIMIAMSCLSIAWIIIFAVMYDYI